MTLLARWAGGVRGSIEAWRRFCAGRGNVRAIDLGVISPLSKNAAGPFD